VKQAALLSLNSLFANLALNAGGALYYKLVPTHDKPTMSIQHLTNRNELIVMFAGVAQRACAIARTDCANAH